MTLKSRSNLTSTIIFFVVASLMVALFFHGISYRPPDIDHAKVIRSLNKTTLAKGKDIYNKACVACHGTDGTASLPQARSFSKDKLRFGNKPYDMWKTLTNGAGMMAAQTWLNPAERYYVIQYIREEFMKKSNPRQYFKINEEYLAKLPKSQRTIEEQKAATKKEALNGSLKYGQEWFMHNKSDYGYAIHSPLKDRATCVLTVLLDSNVQLSYNLLRMGTVAAWKGQLNLSDTKFNQYRGEGQPFVEGAELPGLGTWQWTYNNKIGSLNSTTGVRAPLPAEFLDYHGYYKYGRDVILSYSVMKRKVLEYPQALIKDNNVVMLQTLQVEPGAEQSIYIGQLPGKNAAFREGVMNNEGNISAKEGNAAGNILVSATQENKVTDTFIAAGIVCTQPGLKIAVDDEHRLMLTIPESVNPITLKVARISAKGDDALRSFASYVKEEQAANKFAIPGEMIKGGAALWSNRVDVKGTTNVGRPHFDPRYHEDEDKTAPGKLVKIPKDYPYALDDIGLPFNNPYNAWVRPTSLGFMSDGRLVLGTYTGDVWIATGIDDHLENISWQRIAAGLYEPMGIKILEDKIYVTCRNGIVLLRDLNGDGETDFYENFFSDNDVSGFFHAFNFGLETDSKGNFYYVKPGEYTDNKDPGNVIKVSADGKKWESLATGFRVNNGITVTPDDRIFVSDNQGNWTPGNKINFIEKGKYYGYVPNLFEANGWSPDGMKLSKEDINNKEISPLVKPVPDTFAPPALWIPQEFDNSPGGGVWSDKSWGPLGDRFIHTSYGTGWAYYFMPHVVDGVTQASMIAMPFQFDAGIQRAAVNPVDKQIYTTGLTGWDDGVSVKFGTLGRIRYKGGEGHLLKDAEVVKGGIRLTFNFELDRKQSGDTSDYTLHQWNYKWTSRYGSAHYSVKKPGIEGEDRVVVNKAVVADDGQSVLLSIPQLRTSQSMRIRFDVTAKDGSKVKDAVYMTIHRIPE